MNNKFLKLSVAVLFSVLFLGSLIWADGNGIWHLAKDVQPGIFGADDADTSTFYIFQNPINFINNALYKGTELDTRYVNEAQANSITSTMIGDGEVTNTEINFNYSDSTSKGGNAINSNSCTGDAQCEMAVGVVSGELKVNTIRSNGNGNVVIVLG